VPYISGTLMKIPKQTLPNRDQLLKRHSSVFIPPEKTSVRPKKTLLEFNFRSRIKSDRPIRI
jgi:hypothetical protein